MDNQPLNAHSSTSAQLQTPSTSIPTRTIAFILKVINTMVFCPRPRECPHTSHALSQNITQSLRGYTLFHIMTPARRLLRRTVANCSRRSAAWHGKTTAKGSCHTRLATTLARLQQPGGIHAHRLSHPLRAGPGTNCFPPARWCRHHHRARSLRRLPLPRHHPNPPLRHLVSPKEKGFHCRRPPLGRLQWAFRTDDD